MRQSVDGTLRIVRRQSDLTKQRYGDDWYSIMKEGSRRRDEELALLMSRIKEAKAGLTRAYRTEGAVEACEQLVLAEQVARRGCARTRHTDVAGELLIPSPPWPWVVSTGGWVSNNAGASRSPQYDLYTRQALSDIGGHRACWAGLLSSYRTTPAQGAAKGWAVHCEGKRTRHTNRTVVLSPKACSNMNFAAEQSRSPKEWAYRFLSLPNPLSSWRP